MTNILFIPAMECNLRCPVCHFTWNKDGSWDAYGLRGRRSSALLSPAEWLAALERFAPYHLEITGGEPTLYPGLAELLHRLPEGCIWSITSNLVPEAAFMLPPEKCASFTVSWHGSPLADFKARVDAIASRGVIPSVSLVVRPHNLDEARGVLALFGPYYRVNLLRELNPSVDWAGEHADAWAALETMAVDYGGNLVVDDIPPNYQFATYAKCDAGGAGYFCAFPDGTAYRCYSDAFMRPALALGHVATFQPLPPASPCGNPCAGCAADYRVNKEAAA